MIKRIGEFNCSIICSYFQIQKLLSICFISKQFQEINNIHLNTYKLFYFFSEVYPKYKDYLNDYYESFIKYYPNINKTIIKDIIITCLNGMRDNIYLNGNIISEDFNEILLQIHHNTFIIHHTNLSSFYTHFPSIQRTLVNNNNKIFIEIIYNYNDSNNELDYLNDDNIDFTKINGFYYNDRTLHNHNNIFLEKMINLNYLNMTFYEINSLFWNNIKYISTTFKQLESITIKVNNIQNSTTIYKLLNELGKLPNIKHMSLSSQVLPYNNSNKLLQLNFPNTLKSLYFNNILINNERGSQSMIFDIEQYDIETLYLCGKVTNCEIQLPSSIQCLTLQNTYLSLNAINVIIKNLSLLQTITLSNNNHSHNKTKQSQQDIIQFINELSNKSRLHSLTIKYILSYQNELLFINTFTHKNLKHLDISINYNDNINLHSLYHNIPCIKSFHFTFYYTIFNSTNSQLTFPIIHNKLSHLNKIKFVSYDHIHLIPLSHIEIIKNFNYNISVFSLHSIQIDKYVMKSLLKYLSLSSFLRKISFSHIKTNTNIINELLIYKFNYLEKLILCDINMNDTQSIINLVKLIEGHYLLNYIDISQNNINSYCISICKALMLKYNDERIIKLIYD